MARVRLDGWKEISAYLRHSVRTAIRWEQERNLPVYHPPGEKRGAVLAFSDELDNWLTGNQEAAVEPESETRTETANHTSADAAPEFGQSFEIADRLFQKGRALWEQRTIGGMTGSIGLFRQAIAEDPECALAYIGLADSFITLTVYGAFPPDEGLPRAQAAVKRAREIEPGLAEGAVSEGWLNLLNYDLARAEAAFAGAAQLKRGYGFTAIGHSLVLAARSQLEKAVEVVRSAWREDPLSPSLNAELAYKYYLARRYREAVQQCQYTIESSGDHYDARSVMGLAYVQLKNLPAAVSAFEAAHALSKESLIGLGRLAYIYGITGNHGGARQALNLLYARKQQHYVSPSALAIGYLGLGERDQCLNFLQLTCELRLPQALLLYVEPLYDAIRKDARFTGILRLAGLPPDPLRFSGPGAPDVKSRKRGDLLGECNDG
jgi:tetratricopeptide (TPR) repeat protein